MPATLQNPYGRGLARDAGHAVRQANRADPIASKPAPTGIAVFLGESSQACPRLQSGSHGFIDQPVQRWATVAGHFHRAAGVGAVQRCIRFDLHADVGGQVGAVQAGAADDGAGAGLFFVGDLEVHRRTWANVSELAIGEACFNVGQAAALHQLEDHVAFARVLTVGHHLLGHDAITRGGQGAGHLLAEQFFDLGRLQLLFVQMALEYIEHAGAERRQWRAFGRYRVTFEQALYGTVARHGYVHAGHADEAGLGVADEVHAVDRLEDKTERGEADNEDPGAEHHGAQATERGHAAAAILDLARLGEVVPLQGRQHVAHGHDVARQVRGDQVAQGGNILGIEVLELTTGAAALAIVGANLQLYIHGQAEVVDDELQAALVHFTHGQRLRGGERQAAGGQVDYPCFGLGTVGVEEAQLGRDFGPGMLVLGFGFVDNIGVYAAVHQGNFLELIQAWLSDHHQQHGDEYAAGGEGHGPRRPGVEPTLKAGQIAGQFGVLAGPGLLIKAEEHVDFHQRAHDLVVIENHRVRRADPVAGTRQQQGQDQAGDADPQQVSEDEGAAVLEGGDDCHGQAEQRGPHRHALVEQHHAGEQTQAAYPPAQGAAVLAHVVAVPAELQLSASLDKARFRLVFHGVDRGVRHVEGVVTQAHQAEPAGLVVAGQKLEAAQAPVLQRVAFHVGDKARVGDDAGTEHRHAPGHGQHALGQGH